MLRTLRTTIRADSDPAREVIFDNLTHASVVARFAVRLHTLLGRGWLSSLFVALYGARTYLVTAAPRQRSPDLLLVAVHSNARRQVGRVAEWFGDRKVARVSFGARNLFSVSALAQGARLARSVVGVRRALRLIHRVNQRYSFLVACRVAGGIACYARARQILSRRQPGAVVVSSDTNPEELAFTEAASRFGIPTVFIPHAFPNHYTPRLRFTLALMESEAALDARRSAGAVEGQVVLLGVEGKSAAMDASRLRRERPTIGIFAPKVVDWDALEALVLDCQRALHARAIVIRWHPSMLEPAPSRPVLRAPSISLHDANSRALDDVAAECDWVISDANSNVHLTVLKRGIPTVAVRGLGRQVANRVDMYGFVDRRIIPPIVQSVRELSLEALVQFYGGDWPARFAYFDGTAGLEPSAAESAAREAIRALIATRRRA